MPTHRSYTTSRDTWSGMASFNYAERQSVSQRVGTAITEGAANFLANCRMNHSQQMRWSRRDADLLQQVRCAVYSGTLGFDFGQRFQRPNDPYSVRRSLLDPRYSRSPIAQLDFLHAG